MEHMNYDEFKAVKCANCKYCEPVWYEGTFYACNYECNLYPQYGVYLTLWYELDALEGKCEDLIGLAKLNEAEAKDFEESHPGESGDVFRRTAKQQRDEAAALLPEIRKRKEEIAWRVDTATWF